MIDALAVAFLLAQLWMSERTTHAAAALLEEAAALRHLVLADPHRAVARVCGGGAADGAWCHLRLSVREDDGWRSACAVDDPVVRGIDRYYAVEGLCDFPFPFGATHPLRLREVVRR